MSWTELDNPERPVAGDEPPEDVRTEIERRWAALKAEKERRRSAGLIDETVPPERITELLGDTAGEGSDVHKRVEERSKVRTNTTTIPKCEKCGKEKTSCAGGKWFRCFACNPTRLSGSNGKAGHDGASLTTRREPEPAPEPEPVAVAVADDWEPELEPEPPVRRFVIPEFVELERDDDQVVRLARALRALDPAVRRAVLAFAVAYEEAC
jgi:hypothetical protein